MITGEHGERLWTGVLIGLATFAFFAHLLLLAGVVAPALLLPAALAVGLVAAAAQRGASMPAAPTAPPWLAALAIVAVVVATIAVGYGSLATPSRHWDGAAAWDVRTFWLTATPTLQQPFFTDPGVLSPGRDYPVLQPLTIAMGNILLGGNGGRALFPVLFVLLVLVVGTTLRRVVPPAVAWTGAAAVALTPLLVKPTSGSVDSGYADTFLLVCTTTIAAGLVRRDARLAFLGSFLAVLVKPEGLFHAAIGTAVAAIAGERGPTRGGALGLAVAAAVWLPLQQRLVGGTALAAWPALAAIVAFGGSLVLLDAIARRRAWTNRARLGAGLALAVLAAGAAFAVLPLTGGTMRAYVDSADRLVRQLDRLPVVAWGFVQHGLFRGDFGLAYWFTGAAVLAAASRRALRDTGALVAFVAAGLAMIVAAFVLSPEPDVAHHVRSSLPRLLLHWLGPSVLLGGVALAAISDRQRTDATAP